MSLHSDRLLRHVPPFSRILLISSLLRVALIIYSEWHDAHSIVKYTDVDYRVFSDAAQFVLQPSLENRAEGPLAAYFHVGRCAQIVTHKYRCGESDVSFDTAQPVRTHAQRIATPLCSPSSSRRTNGYIRRSENSCSRLRTSSRVCLCTTCSSRPSSLVLIVPLRSQRRRPHPMLRTRRRRGDIERRS